MFPIRDERGRVAGFGGRLLPGDALGAGDVQPKYVNTSQSPIFDKGSILYALDLAKDAIRSEEQAVIVEGYMDVIAAHEHGYRNVVASMGTALTERQVALLKRSTSTLILSLDADSAGSEATIRSAYEIINNSLRRRPVPNSRGIVRQVDSVDIDLRVLSMPEGRDPDDVIRTNPEQWRELVAQAQAGARPPLRCRGGAARSDAAARALCGCRGADAVHRADGGPRGAVALHAAAGADGAGGRGDAAARDAAAGAGARHAPPKRCAAGLRARPFARPKRSFVSLCCFAILSSATTGRGWIPACSRTARTARCSRHGWCRRRTRESFEQSLPSDLRPQYERISAAGLPAYDDDNLIKALRSTVWGIEQQRLRNAKRMSAAVLARSGGRQRRRGRGAGAVGLAIGRRRSRVHCGRRRRPRRGVRGRHGSRPPRASAPARSA